MDRVVGVEREQIVRDVGTHAEKRPIARLGLGAFAVLFVLLPLGGRGSSTDRGSSGRRGTALVDRDIGARSLVAVWFVRPHTGTRWGLLLLLLLLRRWLRQWR